MIYKSIKNKIMNKEQFLAISLPHDLFVFDNYTDKIIKLSAGSYTEEFSCCNKFYKSKPICYPLSDLTKPIEHKGEKFVPIEKLQEMNDGENIYIHDDDIGIDNGYDCVYYISDALNFLSVLIEWHFDIAGLIEKGEAIDVNTLPENPYK